jgi:hypothetical protein
MVVPAEIFGPNSDPTLFIVIVSIAGGVAIVSAIVVGVVTLTRIAVRHRERMARIGMGIDPDSEEPLSQRPLDRSSPPSASTGAWDRFTGPRSQAPRDV